MDVVRSLARFCTAAAISALALLAPGKGWSEANFVPVETQYIAALGPTDATSGNDAATWGLWAIDPGPRGVRTSRYQSLIDNGFVAPRGWQFDPAAWWLEEHGLIMEKPGFPLPPGQYVVTGGREATAVLTVDAADGAGNQAWQLSDAATLYDVTHLGCRAALYTASAAGQSCTPDRVPTDVFPMVPGRAMPTIAGCSKQDYQVLIVIGKRVEG